MRPSLTFHNRMKAYKIIYLQFIVAALVALGFLVFANKQAGFSAFLGGLICILPLAVFARYFFSRGGAQQSPHILKTLFIGEAIKIMLTVLLFMLVIKYTSAQPLYVLIGFVASQMTFWVAPIIMKT